MLKILAITNYVKNTYPINNEYFAVYQTKRLIFWLYKL
jgi:hypothetical protein